MGMPSGEWFFGNGRLGFLAIFHIHTAFPLQFLGCRRPDRSRRALRQRLESWIRVTVFVEPTHRRHLFMRQMLLQTGHYAARMYCVRHNPGGSEPPIEFHCEQRIGCFRLAVSEPLVVIAPLEMNVIEMNRRKTMPD